jgi:hypothetical protein
MRLRALTLVATLPAAALAIMVLSGAGDGPIKGRMVEIETKAKPAVIGVPDSSRWTATTYEAAASEANQKVLAGGRPVTVTGEVVDVSCYLQLGKRGPAHVACGMKCIANGQPIGLLDAADTLYILFPEEHHPRRDGQVDLKRVFLPLVSKTVTVSGMMTEIRGYRALFVRAEPIGAVAQPAGAK